MTKHTPGPWTQSLDPANPNPRIFGANDELILVVSSGPVFAQETEANARLIAAAPTMYEFIKTVSENGNVYPAVRALAKMIVEGQER